MCLIQKNLSSKNDQPHQVLSIRVRKEAMTLS